ncbi:response regulator transcription factor [Carnobacterium gallinarum]|uniref:response regulator transcription factor n=1 Tax=Carnobacterium gallinarum TaxID=2749 RepID=UPI0005513BDD|nr:response regulator transcription factor [Carnobacterium gallinarum]
MDYTILIVENDMEISELVSESLFKEGYHIKLASDIETALLEFKHQIPDLIVLDIRIPKQGGVYFLKKIREISNIPVLLMSSKKDCRDQNYTFDIGESRWLEKPFSTHQLLSHVKKLLNKYYKNREKIIKTEQVIGELQLDFNNYVVIKNGRNLNLTLTEFKIFVLFISFPDQIFTKAQIYQQVWQEEYFGDENVINVHIRRLREKIENVPSKPQYIKTIWGVGYKLGDIE